MFFFLERGADLSPVQQLLGQERMVIQREALFGYKWVGRKGGNQRGQKGGEQ
jgi:hypothetical protein